jgi:uncharacterized protein (DUF1800 family)
MDASFALQRFGLGPRYNFSDADRTSFENDPRNALKAALSPTAAMPSSPDLPSTAEALVALFEQQQAKKAMREQMQNTAPSTPSAMNTSETPAAPQPKDADAAGMHVQRDIFLDEAQARFTKAFEDKTGLMERLVWFWSNHFAVSVSKGQQVRATAGSFEREAIRPHVLGRFSDMLLAVEQHPTMLFYLDNRDSIGPDSEAGQRRQKGLNENLAREIMELHTLGVNGGYTQADVTNLARIITGWTYAGAKNNETAPGTFFFNANTHQPGADKVMGKTYAQSDIKQGEAALHNLASNPATAKHLALKFARHFVDDNPPPTLVDALAKNFLSTGGDLKSFTETLLASDEAWNMPPQKLRLPQVYLMAASRALNLPPDKPQPLVGAMKALGQPLWEPAGPNGFGDTAADWASPEGLKLRLGYASLMAGQTKISQNPREAVAMLLGKSASQETVEAVSRAESRQQGLALLLMSPEFQRC